MDLTPQQTQVQGVNETMDFITSTGCKADHGFDHTTDISTECKWDHAFDPTTDTNTGCKWDHGFDHKYRRVSVAREARSTAPKVPRPRSGLGTRPFNFFQVPVFFLMKSVWSAPGV